LPPREKKAQTLNLLRKELLILMKKFQCSSGTVIQDSAASALTMVAWLGHPHLTHLRLIPLLQPKFMMMMTKKRKVKKTTTTMMSEASRRPLQHFLVLNDKGGEISIKA
jgi:hypothetical protein